MGDRPSQEETATQGSEERGPGQRIVTSYDFKHPARVNKAQLRTLENLHDNFARLLSSTFSGAMRAVVDVDTAFVDQTTYAEFIMSLSNPTCSYQFNLNPIRPPGSPSCGSRSPISSWRRIRSSCRSRPRPKSSSCWPSR